MPDNVTVSEKPWSDYSEADYTPEQWHAACLIHQHEGAPTAKSQCKLPVRTPNGTLNRNGVHAAAAALAGARGGVNATPAEKSAAARAIVRLYGQLDEKAPPSMMALMHQEEVDEFLEHFGIKGMKWNLRKAAAAPTNAESKVASAERARAHNAERRVISAERARAHNAISDRLSKGIMAARTQSQIERILSLAKTSTLMQGIVKLNNVEISPDGKKALYSMTIARLTPGKMNTDAKDGVQIENLLKEVDRTPDVPVAGATKGQVADMRKVAGFDKAPVTVTRKVTHSESLLDNFLKHYGVKGMRWGVRKAEGSGGSKSKSSSPSKKEVKEAQAAKDVHVSADAERFVKTRMKSQHEMSDREIREAVQRAEWAKKYDAAFNPDANAQLRAKVDQLRLQRDYASLSREMNPTKLDRVNNFVTKADSAFQSYQHINELSGGVLNATLAKSMGLTKPESRYERLLRENDILSAEKTHSTLLRDLHEPQIQRDFFPRHSKNTPTGRHVELPGKHRA